jgi:transposase-like protein
MRVRARIPQVDPLVMQPPAVCPYDDCQGRFFKPHQLHCVKLVRDTQLDHVITNRRRCLSCGRTHRVYPRGVSTGHHSDRLKGFSVLLYILGISYRGVEDVLTALGFYLDHTTVYRNVQAAGRTVLELRQRWLQQLTCKVSVAGADLTYLSCRGETVAVAVMVDADAGIMLDVEILGNEETDTLHAWLQPLLDLVGAEVLISDDQDGFKSVADEAGVSHQICRQHVTRNVLDFVGKTAERVWRSPPPVPEGLDLSPQQLLEDLETLEWIMLGHPESASQILAELYDRYCHAPAPRKGQRATIWYRMRNHILRLWNHWQRYTCYRQALGHEGLPVDETNNVTERNIGWNIKDRYRTMRGYKREESIINVALLTSWLREEPGGRDMSPLFTS